MKTQSDIDAIATRVRESGLPDSQNRWLGMTPEKLAANEAARKRQTTERPMPTPMGPKEQQLQQLRAQRNATTTTTKWKEDTDMPRTAKTAKPAKTAAAAETKKGATPKAPAPAKSAKRAQPAKAAPKKKAAAARARTPVVTPGAPTKAVRPGSKMETIRALLARSQGCTAKEVMKACEWPSVSMPQQAKSLGIELFKHKDDDGVTHYADHAFA